MSNALYTEWLEQRLQHWQRLQTLVEGNRRDRSLEEAREVLAGYRSLASDLSLARRHAPGTEVHRALEALYLRTHKAMHRQPLKLGAELWHLYAVQVPASVRVLRTEITVTTLIFVLSGLLAFLVVAAWPDLGAWFLSDEMMLMVQNRTLWTDNLLNVIPSSLLAYELMTNNITVALTAFALGWIFGLGTLYVVVLNGLLLGCAFGYTAEYDMALPLFKFVIAHGIVELSVICLAAAAGFAIGRALARPGARGRMDSVRESARDAGALAAVCVPFLIGSGIIEGYVSPNDNFDLTSRVVIGVLWFVVLLLALNGRLTAAMHQIWLRARNDR